MSEKNKDGKKEILTGIIKNTNEKKPSKIDKENPIIPQENLIAKRLFIKTNEKNPFSLNKDKKDTQEQKQEPKIVNEISTAQNPKVDSKPK